MEVNEPRSDINLARGREQFATALAKLRLMKSRVSELRAKCESLRELQPEEPAETAICRSCGKEIAQDQQVTVKDSYGNPQSCYHRDCFKAIWLSENWRIDYSSPGFLRLSKRNP